MMDFFSKELLNDPGLKLFSPLHIGISAVFIILLALIVVFRKKLRNLGHFTVIRRTAATILFANMFVHYAMRIILGIWSIEEDLPLHICFVTNFFMMYILFTDNKHGLYRVIYFFTLIGPLPAIVWPDLHRGPSGWVFYQFIISHHFLVLVSAYCLFVLGYEVNVKSAIAAFFIGNGYVGLMAILNRILGTNYVMLDGLPNQLYEVYPFLNAMPAFFWLELVGVVVFLSAYALTIPARRERSKS